MSGIGLPELLILLVIVLVIFGGRRLPQLGRDIGSGMRGFKDSVTGKDDKAASAQAVDPPARAGDDPTIGTDADPVEPIVDGEIVRDRT